MDSVELLAREDEFKKLNKQLEKKTESLMKEIEQAMQKQDIFSEFNHNLRSLHTNNRRNYCNSPKSPDSASKEQHKSQTRRKMTLKSECNLIDNNSTQVSDHSKEQGVQNRVICNCCLSVQDSSKMGSDLEFLHAFVSVNVQDKVLPQAFLKESLTVENVCKFLSSKVKLMQEQIDKLQATVDKKTVQCEVHLTKMAELESERMSLLHKASNVTSAANDARAKCVALQKRLDEKDRLYKEQRSETDKLTSEVKRLRYKCANAEAKLSSQETAVDALKQQLEGAKTAEKEFRDSTRNLATTHQNAISRLEHRIKTLTCRIDKQVELIDNLRKQNALLATDGAVKALEKDYSSFLTRDF